MTTTDRTLLRRGLAYVAEYLRAEPLILGASIVGSVVFAAAAVGATVVLGRVVDDVLAPALEGEGADTGTVAAVLGAVAAVAVVRSVAVIARRFFGGMGTARVKRHLQRRVSDRFFSVPLESLRSNPTGRLLAHIDSDAEAATEPLMPLPLSIGAFAILVFAFIALFAVDPALAAVGAVLLPTIGVMQRVFGHFVERPAIRVRRDVGEVSRIAHESFDGAVVVKTLGREAAEADRFRTATDRLRTSRVHQSLVVAIYNQALAVLPDLGVVLLLLVGTSRVGSGAVSTGQLVQAVALFGIISFPVRVLGYFFATVPTGTVARDRLERFFDLPDDSLLASGTHELPAGPLAVRAHGLRVRAGAAVLLDGVDLDVPAERTVALVGSTGSGKTTLVRAIARLVEIEGSIDIGGIPLGQIDLRSLRRRTALALQEPFLFADTLDENIRLGLRLGAEDRDQAAADAGAHHFVAALPRGYDTIVGERGVTLSGGQRQRVALTRALARNPGLLLLDDATSAVDPVVETAILERLRSTRATVIVVAQRLSTIRLADEVVYLRAGRVAASGTHEQLLARPDYAALVQAYEEAGDSRAVTPTTIDEKPLGEPARIGALSTLRRGIARTPSLRVGLAWSALFGLAEAAGRLVIPVLVQQTIDHGFGAGLDRGFVNRAVLAAAVVIVIVAVSGLIAKFRMVRAAERGLYDLRVQGFRRAHQLSLTDLNEERRGELVSRVTSDVDTIARFLDWGALTWIVQSTLLVGIVGVMAAYSWQLTLISVGGYALMLPALRWLQQRQVAAYALRRTRVGQVLGLTGEVVAGAETVRTYGVEDRTSSRLDEALTGEYRAALGTTRYFSVLFTIGDLFGAFTLIVVVGAVLQWGVGWGLELGEVIAIMLLLNLAQGPIGELSEVLDQTQTALAGWDKVLGLLDREPTLLEPLDGTEIQPGPVGIDVDDVWFSYGDGAPVLRGVTVSIPAGTTVAVVGETGSGKTTFARLLVRLTDPTAGEIRLSGVPLDSVAPEARHAAVRMVPQDGFLFDTTIRTNISYGREGADDAAIEQTIRSLGLEPWVASLPGGLDTPVGERGELLSVGERQLVAAARAALADPGLLVLDEATSSVDPETEQMLGQAIDRLSAHRTTVAIAHRLSTAERADLVLVFDDGRLVEQGTHDELRGAGGRYAALHASWIRTALS